MRKSSSTQSGSVERSASLFSLAVYRGRCAKTSADSKAEPLNRTSKGGRTGRAACGKLIDRNELLPPSGLFVGLSRDLKKKKTTTSRSARWRRAAIQACKRFPSEGSSEWTLTNRASVQFSIEWAESHSSSCVLPGLSASKQTAGEPVAPIRLDAVMSFARRHTAGKQVGGERETGDSDLKVARGRSRKKK